ncbi:membrane dipeptidase [Shinella sp. BE166]
MTEQKPVPIFDGHNDVLFKLHYAQDADKVALFKKGAPPDWHIDLPRAKQGGFAGGMFAVFAPSPESTDPCATHAASDFSIDEPMPPALAMDEARATTVSMASILFDLDRAGAVSLCRTAQDIRTAMERGIIAAVFHMEGAEAIDRDLTMLDMLYGVGLRSIGPVWSRPNIFGHGVPFRFPSSPDTGPGLTDYGKNLIQACNQMKVLVDLSHLNERGFRDVAALSNAPLVATHSNVHRICPHARNLTDWQLGAIRESQGLVGLNFETSFLHSSSSRVCHRGREIITVDRVAHSFQHGLRRRRQRRNVDRDAVAHGLLFTLYPLHGRLADAKIGFDIALQCRHVDVGDTAGFAVRLTGENAGFALEET